MTTMKKIGIAAAAGFGLLLTPLTLAAQQAGRGRPAGFMDVLQRPKFVAMLVLGLAALALLLTKKMKNGVKVPFLLVSTFLFGLAANLPVQTFKGFSMHPSPICSVAKAILYGFRMPMIVTLAVILFLTLVGPKLFCGWVCPVGAAQELVALLADKLGIRRRKPRFRLSQGVRVGILLLFIFLSGTAIIHTVQEGRIIPLSLYDYINAFHGFEIALQPTVLASVIHFLPFLLTLAFAFFVYRPFCYFVCPIGLVTHLVETIGLVRVVHKKPGCTDCGVCPAKSPCPTVPEILKDAAVRPDCFACAACVNSCPTGELEFRIR